jgi:hypothetical protein
VPARWGSGWVLWCTPVRMGLSIGRCQRVLLEPVVMTALRTMAALTDIDLERFVHRESLVNMWPRLRLLGPPARREWERQLITPSFR